jgi:hypothetical protein
MAPRVLNLRIRWSASRAIHFTPEERTLSRSEPVWMLWREESCPAGDGLCIASMKCILHLIMQLNLRQGWTESLFMLCAVQYETPACDHMFLSEVIALLRTNTCLNFSLLLTDGGCYRYASSIIAVLWQIKRSNLLPPPVFHDYPSFIAINNWLSLLRSFSCSVRVNCAIVCVSTLIYEVKG